VSQDPAPSTLRWPHLLVLLPILGVPIVWALRQGRDGADHAELTAALRAQLASGSLVALHLFFHGCVLGIRWLHGLVPQPPDSAMAELIPKLLTAIAWLNGLAGLAEWSVFVLIGLRAAAGAAYPLTRRRRGAAP
jgi:hypothetical protein